MTEIPHILLKIHHVRVRTSEFAVQSRLASSEHSEDAMTNAHRQSNLAPILTFGLWASAFVWFIAWIG
jgi:hypothetical protein